MQAKMKYFVLLLAISLYLPNAFAWQEAETDEDSPVKVWTQTVENSNFKAFRGQVKINAALTKILDVIRDTANIPKWYHNTIEAKKLNVINEKQSLSYTVTSAPWPVTNRDSVTLVTLKPQENGKYIIELSARPNKYPLQENRIRIPKLEGFWKLVPIKENETEVTLQIAAEPGGEIPSWLANSMVIDMPFYSLSNLKERVESSTK
ncbi:MAG TPA: hypothetical protein ENK73_04170 [Thiomicrospira sp.]|jgi:hypothetical protein|nr:hypothetical protein [Thiomicrospira sp.]